MGLKEDKGWQCLTSCRANGELGQRVRRGVRDCRNSQPAESSVHLISWLKRVQETAAAHILESQE